MKRKKNNRQVLYISAADEIDFAREKKMSMVEDVRLFMETAGQSLNESVPSGDDAALLLEAEHIMNGVIRLKGSGDPRHLRARLMLEELGELIDAMAMNDGEAMLDATVDLVYVTIGTALAFGAPFEAAWNAVQEANMAKFPMVDGKRVVLRDEGGKVLKPEGWKPADLTQVIGDWKMRKIPQEVHGE